VTPQVTWPAASTWRNRSPPETPTGRRAQG
jgi:hypothetical protein